MISKNSTNTVYSYDEKFYETEDVDRTIRIEFFQLYQLNHLQKKKDSKKLKTSKHHDKILYLNFF